MATKSIRMRITAFSLEAMMKYSIILLAALVLFPLSAQKVHSTLIYTLNGTPTFPPTVPLEAMPMWTGGSGDPALALPVIAEDFRLLNSATLSGVTLWTIDTADGSRAFIQQMHYSVYLGASIQTASLVGSGDAQGILGEVTRTANEVGVSPPNSLIEIRQSFNLQAPLSLQANSTYWLALQGYTDPFGVSNNARWSQADSAALGGSTMVNYGGGWQSVGGERAFVLDGNVHNVPESGSTFIMLALSVAALAGFNLYRKSPTGA